ncbi:MAG TPA: tRNA (N(6)-L-threonylcarbamoyladenosine(37)-C(2))-methylthiotransferase MtaB [Candidatus Acidoferrum sp.]|nr:tRNA (N(6)-L-threonylcarbamoyladenosine(37)-C(2))-methylthiotransferase MtaB [Candidatus Acidoferrum sp.]
MITFSIENFGCRATDADAASIRRQLLARGLTLKGEHSDAEIVVLNTCTVTAAADSQAREAVRKIHRANPNARIVVAGCYAQRAPEEIAAIPGVSCVVGNSHQSHIPAVVLGLTEPPASAPTLEQSRDIIPLAQLDGDSMSLTRGPVKILTGDIFAQYMTLDAAGAPATNDHTRPILKIQDGCNNRCSYCVIPFVRGRSRSLAPDAVLESVRTFVSQGAKEIVLSGINLGSYGRDLLPRADLAAVVRRILAETDLEQLRFSSIEPQDVTEDFIALVASSNRIAPHFHVPLQSGSDRILRAMHRWYRAEHYAERVMLTRRMLPHAGIGADVIVGFPGETPEDFTATVQLVERLPFTYLHVFSFSQRPGTQAQNLDAAVPAAVVRERARTLRAIAQGKATAFRTSLAGRTVRVLTLKHSGDNWTEALTGNYVKLRIAGRHAANQWLRVCVSRSSAGLTELAPAPNAAASSESILENHLG